MADGGEEDEIDVAGWDGAVAAFVVARDVAEDQRDIQRRMGGHGGFKNRQARLVVGEGGVGHEAHADGDASGGNHAEVDGLAVMDAGGISGLDGVAKGVAVFEDESFAALVRVELEAAELGVDAEFDQIGGVCARIAAGEDGIEAGAVIVIEHEGVFDQLDHAGPEMGVGERIEKLGIDENGGRRVVDAELIFRAGKIDGLLERGRRIVHGEERGRHVDKAEAAEHESGEKSGDVAGGSPAKGHHEGLTGDAGIVGGESECLKRGEAFVRLAGSERENGDGERAGEGIDHALAETGKDGAVGDEKETIGLESCDEVGEGGQAIAAEEKAHGGAGDLVGKLSHKDSGYARQRAAHVMIKIRL